MVHNSKVASPTARSGEQGFTLIELLVVILIIGILAGIAIPSFLNQRTKGQDACAKVMVRTMQTAMAAYYLDHNAFSGGTVAALQVYEPAITPTKCGPSETLGAGAPNSPGTAACSGTDPGAGGGYCISASSPSGNVFAINMQPDGVTERACSMPEVGACPLSGSW
ncbi:MAG: type IV pilin protein [Solirubrobacterales bacterium]